MKLVATVLVAILSIKAVSSKRHFMRNNDLALQTETKSKKQYEDPVFPDEIRIEKNNKVGTISSFPSDFEISFILHPLEEYNSKHSQILHFKSKSGHGYGTAQPAMWFTGRHFEIQTQYASESGMYTAFSVGSKMEEPDVIEYKFEPLIPFADNNITVIAAGDNIEVSVNGKVVGTRYIPRESRPPLSNVDVYACGDENPGAAVIKQLKFIPNPKCSGDGMVANECNNAKQGEAKCCPGLVCHKTQLWRCVKPENDMCAGADTLAQECGGRRSWGAAPKCCDGLVCARTLPNDRGSRCRNPPAIKPTSKPTSKPTTIPGVVVLDTAHPKYPDREDLLGLYFFFDVGAWEKYFGYNPEEIEWNDPKREIIVALWRDGIKMWTGKVDVLGDGGFKVGRRPGDFEVGDILAKP